MAGKKQDDLFSNANKHDDLFSNDDSMLGKDEESTDDRDENKRSADSAFKTLKAFNKRIWKDSASIYLQLPILWVFMLGIASGFPFLLTGSTLMARMKESGVSIETIGSFAMVGIPYTFKFLIAPLIDSVRLTKAKTHLAHRKSWGISTQALLAISLFAMGMFDPAQNILIIGILAFMTATFSAMQDIVIDALRIEIVKRDTQGAASAALVTGYRIAMLLSGAGALFLAEVLPWGQVYYVGAGIMALCTLVTASIHRLYGYEEAVQEGKVISKSRTDQLAITESEPRSWIYQAIIAPLADFFKRPAALVTLLFVATFKLGEAMAGSLSMPFYLDLGFTKTEIAAISKIFGFVATIFGAFLGGIIVKRWPIIKALFVCGTLQLASNLCFVWLAQAGHSNTVLTISITIENVTAGMNTAAFVAFMSQLCNVRFTATQYALLSSLSTIGRTLVSSSCGFMVSFLGWTGFFVTTVFCGIPGLVLLFFVAPALNQNTQESPPDSNQSGSHV